MSAAQKRCYYEVLGCARDASSEDLRKAYKREALKHHPDRNPGNPAAEVAFKEVNEAYQVLTDDGKRQVYNQFGHAGLEGGAGGFDGGMGDVFAHMQDLFTEMFSGSVGFGGGGGRQRRGGDLRAQVRLTLREAAFGTKRDIVVRAPARCGDCSGSGARKGTVAEVCSHCRGTGQVSNARGFVMFTAPCQKCHGHGTIIKDPCATCSGMGIVERPRKVTVTFPAGIDAGQRLRVSGQGACGAAGTPAGDLYVEVDVEGDARFERDGADLVTRVHLTFTDASLGAEIAIPAFERDEDATHTITVPPGTQSGAVFQLKGAGAPRLDGRGRGILVAVVQVDVPTVLTDKARTMLRELDVELREAALAEGKKRASAK
ncbi:MAG: molecular chaperone DnaJ [Polyangiaceae bacterium]